MNNVPAQQTSQTSAMAEYENTRAICKKLMETKHYAKMGEEGIFAIVEKARAVGMNPVDALNGGMYCVQGRVELSSNAMNQLIRQAGHSIRKDPASNNEICILHGKRRDNGDTWTEQFSIEEAKAAKIYFSPKGIDTAWQKYPRDMLFARALSRLARQLFPDVLRGCYVEGEVKDLNEYESDDPAIDHITDQEAINLASRLVPHKQRADAFMVYIKDKFGIEDLRDLPRSIYDSILKQIDKADKELADKAIECQETTVEQSGTNDYESVSEEGVALHG